VLSIYNRIYTYYQKKQTQRFLVLLAIILPLIPILYALSKGYIALWYDPARDLLEASNNLHKLTLIGPTSGIPGIFYGPYWIWLLSFGLIFSKNPVFVILITATIPYFILFPLLWFRFTRFFGFTATTLGWLFFIMSTGKIYASALWNPYSAPLFALGVIYLLIISNLSKVTKRQLLISTVIGLLLGLTLNFHISFGIAFTFGVFLYVAIDGIMNVLKNKKHTKQILRTRFIYLLLTLLGLGFTFIPTLIFEWRHGFHQMQTLIQTLTQYGVVISIKGLSQQEIAQSFFETFAKILSLPNHWGLFLILFLVSIFAILVKVRKITLNNDDKKILTILSCIIFGIVSIYLTAKNPVWAYHFISVDIIFLLLITFILSKIKLLNAFAFLWIVVVLFNTYHIFFQVSKHTSLEEYNTKKAAVISISQDANNQNYSVYAYTPSIYNYDYSYLFQWLTQKNVPYDPSENTHTKLVYIIVPIQKNALITDFINYRGSEKEYRTEKIWQIESTLSIIKKVTK